jgi:hypothetical protein
MILLSDQLSTEKTPILPMQFAMFLPLDYILMLLLELVADRCYKLIMIKRVTVLVFVLILLVSGAWAVLHFKNLKRSREVAYQAAHATNASVFDRWTNAVDRVKADRGGASMGPVETPPELRHYSDRYWFLATQIAEIKKYNIPICRDYLDLAAMIERGEMVSVPGVTDTYVLYGVGQRVDDGSFTDDEEPNVTRDYQPLQTLAKSFGGRSYNLDHPADREVLKSNMLSSLRPVALKVLEEVAAAYQQQFDRPLPVSSLVRPEEYQHALRRVNRNAVMIEAPPHSTGLAFDIDYRYMSGAEQTFIMNELAQLKNQGRIEAIRERNANYHVFAFLNGTRPSDDLITASLDDADPSRREANHADSEAETVPANKRPHASKKPGASKSSKTGKPKAAKTTRKRRRH